MSSEFYHEIEHYTKEEFEQEIEWDAINISDEDSEGNQYHYSALYPCNGPYENLFFHINDLDNNAQKKRSLVVFRNVAMSKGADVSIVQKNIAGLLLRIDIPSIICDGLFMRAFEKDYGYDNKGKAVLFPLMCGLGKSTAIKLLMSKVLQYGDYGMIIVTDEVSRMEEYMELDEESYPLAYHILKKHKDKVVIWESEKNVQSSMRSNVAGTAQVYGKIKHRPILIMSTQRYFNILSHDDIENLLEWTDENDKKHERSLIIIDEKPLLYDIKTIRATQLNDIDSALADTNGDDSDKGWCRDQWQRFRKIMNDALKTPKQEAADEKKLKGYIHIPDYSINQTEQDDMRFWSYVRQQRDNLESHGKKQAYSLLKAVKQIIDDYALLFINPDSQQYRASFLTVIDRTNNIRNLHTPSGRDVKVFILDGTADLHPDYRDLELFYIDKIPGMTRSLEELHLHFVDVKTSRNIMSNVQKRKNSFERINKYFQVMDGTLSCNKRLPYPAFCILQAQEIAKKYFESTEHLGNIKGGNKYRDRKTIVQVGLYRLPPQSYVVYKLARNPKLLKALKDKSPKESSDYISDLLRDAAKCYDIMNPMILADIQQNMFRGSIRNVINTEPYHYYVFCGTSKFKQLIEIAKKRYEHYGATVTVESAPLYLPHEIDKVKNRKSNSGKTIPQLILKWIADKDIGFEYTKEMITNSLLQNNSSLSKESIRSCYKQNASVKEILQGDKIPSQRGKYRRSVETNI